MYPSAAGLGGWTGHKHARPDPVKLADLNRDYRRFPDTCCTDSAALLRNPQAGAEPQPLELFSTDERQPRRE